MHVIVARPLLVKKCYRRPSIDRVVQKTQCDLTYPCGRCKRLELECASERPLGKRGRPSKPQAAVEPPVNIEATNLRREIAPFEVATDWNATSVDWPISDPQDLHLEVEDTLHTNLRRILSGIHNLPVDNDLACNLLWKTLSLRTDLGVWVPFSITDLSQPEPSRDASFTLSHATVLSLLSLALEQNWTFLPPHTRQSIDLVQDSLRIQVLSLIPHITWQSCRLSPSQSVALLLLSYTWCFSQSYAGIAARWNDLSHVLAENSFRNGSEQEGEAYS